MFTDNGVPPPTTTEAPATILDTTQESDDDFENLFSILEDELNFFPDFSSQLFPNGLGQIRDDPVAGLTQLQNALDQIRAGEEASNSGFEALGPQPLLIFIALIFLRFFK